MSSIKAVLRTKANSQNLYPIAIRITKDRKASFLYVGQYVKLNDWDNKNRIVKKSHPDSLHINQLILKKLSEANKKLIDAEMEINYQSVSAIKRKVINKKNNDFFVISNYYLKQIKDRKKFHQLDIEKQRIQVFKDFIKKDTLGLAELDLRLIKEFDNYLLNNRKLARRTIANYMIMIRTILNLAISDFSIDNIDYPFGKNKYQIKFPETKKIGLNIDEIRILENIKELTKAQQYALNAWLISFYFAGIRISDVLLLKWKDFLDNRLEYRMGKNSKLVSLKIPKKVLKILDELDRNEDSTYLFRELEGVDLNNDRQLRTRIKTATRNFNRRLEIIAKKAGINKKLSMHIARHSFGNISGDKIPIQMLQKLYRHSSITTTILYQSNFMQKDTDEALDKVINF
jgi:integrase